jgi:CheY-like chemotaxis protein
VIPELAAQPIGPAPAAAEDHADTSPGLDAIAGISATVSDAWFADSDKSRNKGATGPAILVVDDDPSFRNFLRDSLATQGYAVHSAINGPNALRFIKTDGGVDLVICDLHMPHMDGFELKAEIDQLLGRRIPFIVCTGDASEDKIATAGQVGAAALISKPIEDLDAFFSIVADTLRDAGIGSAR